MPVLLGWEQFLRKSQQMEEQTLYRMPAAHSLIVKVATVKSKERLLQWSGELSTSTCILMRHPSKSS